MNFVTPNRGQSKYCVAHDISPETALKMAKKGPGEILYNLTRAAGGGGTPTDGPRSRRTWVNWHSYLARRTVEIRVHQGTLNYTKIRNWIIAHVRFVDWCVAQDAGAVYKALKKPKEDVRDLFLYMTQAIWKDRRLGKWFRGRALELHGELATLQPTERQLRKAGVDPKAPRPSPETSSLADSIATNYRRHEVRIFLVRGPITGGRWVCSNHADGGDRMRSYLDGSLSWGGNAVTFQVAADVEAFASAVSRGSRSMAAYLITKAGRAMALPVVQEPRRLGPLNLQIPDLASFIGTDLVSRERQMPVNDDDHALEEVEVDTSDL
jgi:hypothetical protein